MTIVIVGGGIVGTATAARLGETDHDVTLLERGEIGSETTAASAGILMDAVIEPTPFDLGFRERARAVYDRLFEGEALEAERIGVCYVAETDAFADRLESSAETLRAHGLEASFVSPADLPRLGIDPDGFVGGLHTPTDRICDPTAVANWFADCARRRGVDVRTGVTVTDVRTRDGAVAGVDTDDGRVDAEYVVNAAGPWAPVLNDRISVSIPLRHTLGPMAALEVEGEGAPETERAESLDGPVTILESKRYVRPTRGVDGRGADAWVGEYRTAYEDGRRYDPDECAVPDGFAAAASELSAVIPAIAGATVVDEWVGLRTVTPDGRPIVGETAVDGFLVACGMTGQGITLAPAVADVLCDVISDTVDDASRERLSSARF